MQQASGGPPIFVVDKYVADAPTGRLAIYYGAADTVTALAFAQLDELVRVARAQS